MIAYEQWKNQNKDDSLLQKAEENIKKDILLVIAMFIFYSSKHLLFKIWVATDKSVLV